MVLSHTVSPQEDGLSLRAILRGPLGFSGEQARASLALGVLVDGAPRYPNQPVCSGERLSIPLAAYAPEKPPAAPLPAVRVLYEDDALIAVEKPALLQCHPSPSAPRGSDTLSARVCAQLRAAAHPVHRLDAETSGIVLFAKLPYAQSRLQAMMAEGAFHKRYQAWLIGVPAKPEGEIDAPIAREHPDSFTRIVSEQGQRAVSRYSVLKTIALASGETLSLAALSPLTGRTHQLRVHMAHIGCPLLGDTRYGTAQTRALSARLGVPCHQLAAVSLDLIHPITAQPFSIRCPARFMFRPEDWT